jgi:hypothetical protein
MVTRSSSTSPTRLLEAVCHILIWALSLAQQSWDLEVQAAYGQRLPVVDAHRARLGAVGQYRQQIGEHGVLMLRHEPFHLVAPAPFARLADDDERRLAHIAQSHRAAARHGRSVPLPDEWRDFPQIQAKYAGYRDWPEFGPRMPDAVTAFDAVGRRGASAGAERKLKQRAGARHQVDLAVTLQSPSEKAASTASGGGGAGNPPGLAQAKNLLVHFQRLWA